MIEQYRDELVTSIRGNIDDQRVADDREAVASDLLNILHRYVLPSGPSLSQFATLALSASCHPIDLFRYEN